MKFDLRLQNWLQQKKNFYEEQPQVPKEFTGGLDKLSVILLQKIGKPFVISNFYPIITGI